MRIFSARKPASKSDNKRKTGKRILIVTGIMMALFMAGPVMNNTATDTMFGGITAYAAEINQTPNWFQDGGVWKVKDGSGNIVENAWFCDLDGSWYLMDESGCMREGIINDGGHYYSLETAHAGHYGMMRTTNGVYDGVMLTFQQEHNGFYGEILTGAQELINTGVKVTTVSGLPANSVYAKDFGTGSSTAQSTSQQSTNTNQGVIHGNDDQTGLSRVGTLKHHNLTYQEQDESNIYWQ